MWFTSDNSSPAAPEIIEAIVRANSGFERSYGSDAATDRVTGMIREIFEAPEAAVYLVGTGTAANALGLALLCPPWATVFCHGESHVQTDECGAPEFYSGGAKLTPVEGTHARIDPAMLERALQATGHVGVHGVQPGALALTNATELGCVYTPGETRQLADLAHGRKVPVFLDGARFANAVVTLGCTPAEATWKAGIEAMSFGGTKNGMLGAEAVILFDPDKAWEFELRRKRAGHLVSKHRYLAAQFEAYLRDGLWLDLAARANRAASRLATGMADQQVIQLAHPVQANAVFAAMPRRHHQKLHAAGARYYFWPGDSSLDGAGEELLLARFVCSWNTEDKDIDRFLDALN